jgi:hypothetical protein
VAKIRNTFLSAKNYSEKYSSKSVKEQFITFLDTSRTTILRFGRKSFYLFVKKNRFFSFLNCVKKINVKFVAENIFIR